MNATAATEVKASFSAILYRVDRGEEFVLTRRGKSTAYLGPSQRPTTAEAAQAVADLLMWRSKVTRRGGVLGPGETIKSLISRGRR